MFLVYVCACHSLSYTQRLARQSPKITLASKGAVLFLLGAIENRNARTRSIGRLGRLAKREYCECLRDVGLMFGHKMLGRLEDVRFEGRAHANNHYFESKLPPED